MRLEEAIRAKCRAVPDFAGLPRPFGDFIVRRDTPGAAHRAYNSGWLEGLT